MKSIWVCLILAILCPLTPARAESVAEVIALLNQFGIIRVPIGQAPGNGHQAASAILVKQLRQLGYVGQFDILYNVKDKQKLELLLPPFSAQGPDDQYLESLNARVRVFPRSTQDLGEVAVGMSGAPSDEMRIDQAKAKIFVEMAPPNWLEYSTIRVRTEEGTDRLRFREFKTLPSLYEPPRPEDRAEFLKSELGHAPRLQAKIEGLSRLLQLQADGKLLTWSLYGVGIMGERRIVMLLRSLAEAQALRPDLFSRPVVLNFVSNLNAEEWAFVLQRLPPEVLAKLTVMSISDSTLGDKLAGAKAGDILAVNTGSVSQDLFFDLMEQSDLPPTAIGTGAIGYLSVRDKPFLPMSNDAMLSQLNKARNLLEVAQTLDVAWNVETTPVVQFLLDCRDPNSDTCRVFAEEAAKLRAQPDRLCQMLLMAEPLLKALAPGNVTDNLKDAIRRVRAAIHPNPPP